MRRGYLGRRFAARLGGDLAERLDHRGHGEQAAVGRHDAQEIAGEALDFGGGQNGADRLRLFLGREYGAADEARKIIARIEQRLETAEIGFDFAYCVSLGGKVEQRTRITLGDTGDGRTGLGH